MVTSLHNSWSEIRVAFEQILALAQHTLDIFDRDLAQLGLDQKSHIEQIHRLVVENPAARIRIALKQTDHLHRNHPRLIQLLENYAHTVQVQQIPENLFHLRDTLVICDGAHTLVRFEQDRPRSKLILANPSESMPYARRFEDIWAEGGYPFSPNTLGL